MPACSASTRSQSVVDAVAATAPPRATTTASSEPARAVAEASASAAPSKPAATPLTGMSVHAMPRASSAAMHRGGQLRSVDDDGARAHRGGGQVAGRLRRRRRRTAGWPRRWSPAAPRRAPARRWPTASSRCGSEATSPVRTTSSRRGSSITATSDPPAKSTRPLHQREVLAHEVGAERAELLRARASTRATARRWPTPPGLALRALERGGDHPGDGDRRHGVDDDARRRVPAELPGERGDGALGAAVRAGVGRLATPSPR